MARRMAGSRVSQERVQKWIRKGQAAYRAEKFDEALKELMKVWHAEGANASMDVLSVIADLLVKTNQRTVALDMLITVVKEHGETADICASAAMLASNMGFHDICLKLNEKAIEMEPMEPVNHINKADALIKLERLDDAVTYLQGIVPVFPEHGGMWNVLGTAVMFRDGESAARPFYEEGARLQPDASRIVSNLANVCADLDERIEYYERSLELEPDFPESHLGVAPILFHRGDMEKAWHSFAYRDSGKRHNVVGQLVNLTHNIPAWNDEDLAGKSILVTAEQGVGDEIYFGASICELYKQVDEMEGLYIGVDNRLVSLFQRTFPKAKVVHHNTVRRYGSNVRSFPDVELPIQRGELHIDYSISIVNLASRFWTDSSDLPAKPDGYLVPDPERVDEMKKTLSSVGDGPFVGIAWRSGNMAISRTSQYMQLDQLANGLASEGVTLVNLQYGDTGEEISSLEQEAGIKVVEIDGLDLKDDFEGAVALTSCMDFVASAGSSPITIAMGLGKNSVVFRRHYLHWLYGQEDRCGIYPATSAVLVEPEESWDSAVEKMAVMVEELRA